MATTLPPNSTRTDADQARQTLVNRLDDIGWGVFLLMSGALWLLAGAFPSGTWLVATGILLLAHNTLRYFNHLAVNVFTLVLGLLALTGGIADLANVRFPVLPVALIAFGFVLLIKPVRTSKR
jgi:hypothetical protein